jgi:hypothetical protein
MARPSLRQIQQDGATSGGVLRWNSALGEWVAVKATELSPVKTYTWFQDTVKPFIEFKGTSWTVQDRVRFAGTNSRTPSSIKIVTQMDSGATGDFRIVDPIAGTVATVLGISSTSWVIVDIGALSNLSATEAIWEIQVKTSAAQKSLRVSSMDVEF